ncbi:MAG: hypothetical protein OEL54_02985 [Flavobacteriaceae bacterium]|nr:hypothetical protein [Flavobacteriaceae bacterium]
MKKEIKHLLKYLLGITLLLHGAQYGIQKNIFDSISFYYPTYAIYLFHFTITFLILLSLIAVKNVFFEKTGFAFMALSLLKMLASVIFLLPLIQSEKINYIPDVIAFFVPYFLFLFFEIFYSIKLLNSIPKE